MARLRRPGTAHVQTPATWADPRPAAVAPKVMRDAWARRVTLRAKGRRVR